MKLRYSPTSPYVRKVTVSALETGLHDRVSRVPTVTADPASGLTRDNPLGKVPALLTDEGEALIDSPVICEYLDSLHAGPKLIPAAGPARWTALRREALADGILDAAILRLLEGRRAAGEQSAGWIEKQKNVIGRAFD
ncbi:MAG: glutathione S-transferase N-terminal domain-containing protein, partial [Dongiaceae bacterium]